MKTVIEMAREAWAHPSHNPELYDIWNISDKSLERFAALVRADALVKPCCQDFVKCQQVCMPRAAALEREACAKVCDDMAVDWQKYVTTPSGTIAACAAAIRARGQA